MAEITLQLESSRAVKIALELRQIDGELEQIERVHRLSSIPAGDPWNSLPKRRKQLMHLASLLEHAVKDQTPEPPKHERPKQQNTKTVWCEGGCQTALTLDQMRQSPFCRNCRRRAEADE